MMNRLKTALEDLDLTIDRLESALSARVAQLDGALTETRTELAATSLKAKAATKIGNRLDDIIAEVRDILGPDGARSAASAQNEQD